MKPSTAIDKTRARVEFGDFQTPPDLASNICQLLARTGIAPRSLLEPTCGTGSLLGAGLAQFSTLQAIIGVDVNESYAQAAAASLTPQGNDIVVDVTCGDFFQVDWESVIQRLAEPILVIGNPPWVTNSALGTLNGTNLPDKRNFQQHSGIEALTGKSNFDISEWMLIRLLELLAGREATLAMLCKTAVARRVLAHLWKKNYPIRSAELYRIDSPLHFGAAVDACLFVCRCATSDRDRSAPECSVFDSLSTANLATRFGMRDGKIMSDLVAYNRVSHLEDKTVYRWRSGIKHDCSKVMTFIREGAQYRNGLGEVVSLESEFLFPMLRSSDVANGVVRPSRWMLVTQLHPSDDTTAIARRAPRTWAYLQRNAAKLSARASSIYRNRPAFAIFGIGPYSFAHHKVAISALYKKLCFVPLAPFEDRPVVLDDTCNFIDCGSEAEAQLIASILNSDLARQFYSSLIFWDSKRPITVDVLSRLSIECAARALGLDGQLDTLAIQRTEDAEQRTLF